MARCVQGWRLRPLVAAGAAALVLFAGGNSAPAQQTSCARADFEAVVGSAAGMLRDLTLKNTPLFQGKLRELKDKRGWSQEQFMAGAAPFVQDERIAEFDGRSEELLSRIASMGQEGASAAAPDCGVLTQLKGIMQGLVDTQQAKWVYMFGKIDAELAK